MPISSIGSGRLRIVICLAFGSRSSASCAAPGSAWSAYRLAVEQFPDGAREQREPLLQGHSARLVEIVGVLGEAHQRRGDRAVAGPALQREHGFVRHPSTRRLGPRRDVARRLPSLGSSSSPRSNTRRR
jgi:hypothetical protein